MIKNIILINSANFNYLDVSLEKDLFFLGDNGSGKTTVIRAIHYLFSGDVRNLGIPTDKDGFKEYYFRYPNSYMIYVFEDFFIFMYKTSGEIVKLFSKQKFDRSRIIDENSNLYELDTIKRYAKEANLKKTVKSLSQYRDIIYGNDSNLLDFKFTSIKNSEVFIGLFNEIFNIDKSIIDSKSIKKAIQTTLSYEKKVIDFNHEKYLQDIYNFQSEYKFFREFEKQKESIEEAYSLKNILLEYEERHSELLSNILYASLKEQETLQQNKQEYLRVDKKLSQHKRIKIKRENTKGQCEKKCQNVFNTKSIEIAKIKDLKEKFSQKALLESRDSADKYELLKETQSNRQESYIKLKVGFEDELFSIDAEIKSLKYRRDRELQREVADKKENQKRLLKSQLDEKIEKDELKLDEDESLSKIDIQNIKDEIEAFTKDIATKKENEQRVEEKYKKSCKTLNDKYEQAVKLIKESRESKENKILNKTRERKQLQYDIEELLRVKEKKISLNSESYKEESGRILKEIEKFRSMIASKPSSFKEFLNEEVDAWESELYPLLDASLLDMSIEELQPRVLESQRVVSLGFNGKKLKKILTKDEAQERIDTLELESENLQSSYIDAQESLESRYKEDTQRVEDKREFLRKDIEVLQDEIEEFKDELNSLENKLEVDLKDEYQGYLKGLQIYQKDIKAFEAEIQNSYEMIATIEEELRDKRRALKYRIKDLEEEFNEELQEIYKELDIWLEKQRKVVESLIADQEKKKESITKDERLKELENSLTKIEKELEIAFLAKEFLDEYGRVKETIETLLSLENSFKILKHRYEEFSSRVEQKIEDYKYEIEKLEDEKKELSKKDRYLKKGIELLEHREYDLSEIEAVETTLYLYELIDSYDAILYKYKNKKVDLKEKISKLKRLEDSQNGIDISFNLEEYDEVLYISETPNIIEKIIEIHEYKNKKLEILKESGHERFRNFVNSSLPQNMSVFNDSEDKFLTQVSKINKNLQGIDFGVIKDIKLNPKVGDKKSIAKLLSSLNDNVSTLGSLLNENSLFYEQAEVLSELSRLELQFKEIKKALKGSAISLQDTIDLSLSFNENGKKISEVMQLKNESSTGGSMLLKIAIAISILQLFMKEEESPFFLIVDEVSRLHSDNQEKLRQFANKKGFGIVFVTPEPTFSKPESIKYYRFQKNSDNEFEAIELNV